MKIRIATLNVKSLATPSKFRKTANLLKKYKNIDIFTLQETNIHSDKIAFTTRKWPLPSFWTNEVAILINNPRIIVNNSFSTNSRNLILDFALGSKLCRVETVYIPPDRQRRIFFLQHWLPSRIEGNYILTGDFNVNRHPSNRIATTTPRLDPSRLILADK